MNKEVRKICENNGYELGRPTRLDNDMHIEIARTFNECINDYYYAMKQENVDAQIDSIIESIYIILDTFAKMQIQPDGLLDAFMQNKKSIEDNESGIKIYIFYLIKKELNMMKNHRYAYQGDCDIINNYANLKRIFDERKNPYNQEKGKISASDSGLYLFNGCTNIITKYSLSTDVEEDAYRLADLLYHNLFLLVKMGVDPEFIESKINEKIDNDVKRH